MIACPMELTNYMEIVAEVKGSTSLHVPFDKP